MNLTSTVALHNKTNMPRLGLGVYQSPPGKVTYQAVRWALEAGYRHIDTARVYRNEKDDEMKAMDGLNENLRVCWDPSATP